MRKRLAAIVGLFALTGALTVAVAAAPAGAAEFGPIDNVGDLYDVIETQATNPAGDIVTLAPNTTFTLGPLACGLDHDPATPLTIIGNGSTIELDPLCGDSRVLTDDDVNPTVPGRVLRLENLTIRGGTCSTGCDGGGVFTKNSIEIVGSTFEDNHVAIGSSSGGAVAAIGDATITDSVFTGNSSTGPGGAMRIQGTLTMERTTVSGNTGGLSGGGDVGGGISVGGVATITASTISGNSTGDGSNGGGIMYDETLTLVNTTVTGNTANAFGGGVAGDDEDDDLILVYSTIVANTAPEVANAAVGDHTAFASVIAMPLGGGVNCETPEPTTSFGYNVDDDGTCTFGGGPGDRSNLQEPLLLGALADNGGPTQTLLPELTSPLVGAVPDSACQDDGAAGITVDQRGLPRPAPGLVGCDIGAVEVQLPPAPPPPIVLEPTFTG